MAIRRRFAKSRMGAALLAAFAVLLLAATPTMAFPTVRDSSFGFGAFLANEFEDAADDADEADEDAEDELRMKPTTLTRRTRTLTRRTTPTRTRRTTKMTTKMMTTKMMTTMMTMTTRTRTRTRTEA